MCINLGPQGITNTRGLRDIFTQKSYLVISRAYVVSFAVRKNRINIDLAVMTFLLITFQLIITSLSRPAAAVTTQVIQPNILPVELLLLLSKIIGFSCLYVAP